MTEDLLIRIACIPVLGIGAHLLAWHLRLPSILVMMAFGIIVGPVTDFIDPDKIFGDLLLPLVSLSVAIILFEGGLSLRIAELRGSATAVPRLLILGGSITWAVGTIAAYFLLDLDWDMSILLGAILIVTGPTVILPLLKHVRPSGQVGPVLKWEGMVIDPLGAALGVLVLNTILAERLDEATALIALGLLKTIFIGALAGTIGAGLIILLLRRYWIPDFLQSPMALGTVIAAYAISNQFQEESGLMTATVMGIALANQRSVSVRHIIEFKENLGVLLVSGLFILLAARLDFGILDDLGFDLLAFLAIMILIARPAAVAISTIGPCRLSRQDRLFLSWMAPRGIVAAAVASVFALRLAEEGHPQAELLVPATFAMIIATVLIYGLSARPLAYRLGVARPNPQGFLIVGAHEWARKIGKILKEKGFEVSMVDTNWADLAEARKAGISTSYASILSEYALDEVDLGGIGRLIALTHSDGLNALSTLHFAPVLGRANVYQLPPIGIAGGGKREAMSQHLRGRLLFGQGMTYSHLSERFRKGAIIKATGLSEKFDYQDFRGYYGNTAIPMFLINKTGDITIFAADNQPTPQPGQTVIALVDPVEDSPSASP